MLYTGERYERLAAFDGVPYASLRSVLEQCTVRAVDAGEILLSPTKEARSFYLLLDGFLTVHLHDPNARPIAGIQVGECVGELSVIDELFATAFVKAVGPCTVLEMRNEDLWELIHIDPKIAKNLLKIFSYRMRGNMVALSDSQLLQTVPDIIYRLDHNGIFTFLNDAIASLGYVQDDLLGKHFDQLISGDDFDSVSYAAMAERIRQGTNPPLSPPGLFDERRAVDRKTTGLEVRLKRKASAPASFDTRDTNGPIVADVSCTGIWVAGAEEGSVSFLGTIGIIRDITERKRLQAQVEEQKVRMEAIFNTAVDAIIVFDEEGNIESINQAASIVFGYPERDMLDHNISMLMGAPRQELQDSNLTPLSLPEPPKTPVLNREEVGVRRDGTHFPLEVSISEFKLQGRVLSTAILRDITERKESERTIYFQANYDALTQLPNRMLFRRTLNKSIVRARRLGNSLALMFIDLDRFKWINDNMGHPAGDTLLQEVALRLRKVAGDQTMVARLGGDEFTVLLARDMDQDSVAKVAHEILDQLNLPFALHEQEVHISGSVGIALFPKDATDTESLLKQADDAMYLSKNAGKNAYHFITGEHLILEKKYTPTMPR